MTGESTNAVAGFYSYAHKDERLRKQLDTHLSTLKRQGLIKVWYDHDINAGTEWAQEIDSHLKTANIILLLISPDFIASDYCYSVEMKRALERHDAGEARVIPIILRPVDLQKTPFSELMALPLYAKPVTKWPNRDEAFLDVADGIRKAINDLHPSCTQPQSKQLWNVPYPSNPLFVDRENTLRDLRSTFTIDKATAPIQQAIPGLGGIGKTQCALEYAYRYRDNYQAVFWTNANSEKALVAGFVNIADWLQLPEKDAQDQNIAISAVKHWLETNTSWLLILDNADDLNLVYPFLPRKGEGHILLTTSTDAVPPTMKSVKIQKMEQEDEVLFLLRRARIIAQDASLDTASTQDLAIASDIVRVLGGLPLAINQAGAYILETRIVLSDYLHLYQTHHANLLKRRDESLPYPVEPVATTWDLAFEKVQQANPAAVDLLRLCAFLAPDAIPEEIISSGAPDFGLDLQRVAADSWELNAAIRELLKFSLIDRNDKTLTIQRLVQTVLKDGMKEDTQRDWAERAVRAVNRVFPEVDVTTWSLCQHYLPQAQNCAVLIKDYKLLFLEAGRLLYETGRYLFDRAQYAQAKPLYQQALSIRKQVLGSEHPDTARTLHDLARLYQTQGQYKQAEPLFKEALAIREHVLGAHPDTASTLHDLAWLYKDQGQYKQAELFKKALKIRKHVLEDHSDAASTLHELARFYKDQGQYKQAESLFKKALKIRKHVLGPQHPDTASTLHALAWLYQDMGHQDQSLFKQAESHFKQAEPLFKEALEIREHVLGYQHPETANTLHALAWLYKDRGQYEQAEPLFKEALAIREHVLGYQHPQTAATLHNMGQLYQDMGKLYQDQSLFKQAESHFKQAEPLFKEALAIREHVLGYQHPETANTLQALAWFYKNQRQYEQAEPLFKEALEIRKQVLGPQHPATATTLFDLAWLYKDQRQYEQAEPLFKEALKIRKQVLRPQHPDTATTLFDLAWLYKDQRQYEQAEPLFKEALEIRKQVLGPQHPDTATTLFDLAWLYKDRGQDERAEPLFKEALEIREHGLGAKDPDIVK